jgi:hypothetical protein
LVLARGAERASCSESWVDPVIALILIEGSSDWAGRLSSKERTDGATSALKDTSTKVMLLSLLIHHVHGFVSLILLLIGLTAGIIRPKSNLNIDVSNAGPFIW